MTFPDNPEQFRPPISGEIVPLPPAIIDPAAQPPGGYAVGFQDGFHTAAEVFHLRQENAGLRTQIAQLNEDMGDITADRDRWMQTATTDSLTGLPNRLAVVNGLNDLTVTRPGNFAVGFLDIDGLKKVNDTEGHEAGNRLICDAARVIQDSIRTEVEPDNPEWRRPTDLGGKLAARLTGDEFVVAVSGVTAQPQVDAFTTRLTDNLAAAGIRASIGARVHIPGEDGPALLAAADALMYTQKQQRRAQLQIEQRQTLSPDVTTRAIEIVDELDQLGLGVGGLFKLFGETSR